MRLLRLLAKRCAGKLPVMSNTIKLNPAIHDAGARSGQAVWPLLLAVAAVGSNSLALSPILSDVARDLAATPGEIGRAGAAYGAATALSALPLANSA